MTDLRGLDDQIERSAAPGLVRVALDRLADRHPDLLDRLGNEPGLAGATVAVCAASRSLTRLLEADPAAVEVLADLDRRPPVDASSADEMVAWKRRELLRIAARDLVGLDPLEDVGSALAAMAADVFAAATHLTGAGDLAVVGMGKAGAAELNYASDVDVMLVGREAGAAAERSGRALIEVARRCFRVDVDLRPEGRDGPLVRTVEGFAGYWERWARPWEFQALLKSRPIAGDEALMAAFAEAAGEHLWKRPFTADDIRSVRAMKERTEAEAARGREGGREMKRSRGGIRDIEFAVQLLQLVHGQHDPDLRVPATLPALRVLAGSGYVADTDARDLGDAYRFLRRVEHGLQLVDEQQLHTVPADESARDRLARVLGLRSTPERPALAELDARLAACRAQVRSIHERLYFRPLLEAFAGVDGLLSPEAAAARLAAFGFSDADRTRQAVTELTRGLTRSSRLMQQLLPLVLDWLSRAPDPDAGLLGLRKLASGPTRTTALATNFRDSPEVARRLCAVLGTSRWLGERFVRNPDLINPIGTADGFTARTGDELLAAARRAIDWREDKARRRTGLQRFTDREGLRIGAHDVLGLIALPEVGRALGALAEATIGAALEGLGPELPFTVIALGRFAGAELSYASDLDVVFVYDGTTAADAEEGRRVAEALHRFVDGDGGQAIYDIDLDLRPEGRQGPVARSLDAYRTYLERWAQMWERQALARARPVAGDPDLGTRFLEVIEAHVWGGISDDDRREVRRMKARIERERIPPSEDAEFHLKLGKGSLADVEFCAQLLQLTHGVREPSTEVALERLVDAGHLDRADAEVLGEAYRFCERTRNRWFLVRGQAVNSLPTGEPLARLARSLGTTGPDLRDEYRRVTRRSRRVVERVFYGQG